MRETEKDKPGILVKIQLESNSLIALMLISVEDADSESMRVLSKESRLYSFIMQTFSHALIQMLNQTTLFNKSLFSVKPV